MAKTRKKRENIEVQTVLDKNRSKAMTYAILATIALASGLVMVRFLASTTSHLSRVIEKKQESLDTLEQNAESAETLQASLQELDKNPVNGSAPSVLILDALPSVYDAPALNTSLLRIADQAGVSVSSLNNSDQVESAPSSSPEPTPLVVPFSMTGTGSYDNIMNLLESFQDSIRPFLVTELVMTSSEDGVSFTLNAQTYYQPKQEILIREEEVN